MRLPSILTACRFLACLLSLLATTLLTPAVHADPPTIMGSGNFNDGKVDVANTEQYAALKVAGAKACRIPVYPYTYYWAKKTPTPERLDAGLLQAHAAGITPILLFEYYTRFDTPVGDYAIWHAIGKAFADRFRPNSPWWLSQGIRDYGITVYTAFNEPDIDKPLLAGTVYHEALRGLADGVHEANRALKVVPGGIAAPNSRRDFTSSGLGPAIADLLNDGTLDGIDIHTYNGRWAPLADHRSSAQFYFEASKKAWGVTRDINFYTTEFNYQQLTGEVVNGDIGDAAAGSYFLTMIWDNLGVAGNAGTCVSKLAFCWNLFDTTKPDPNYAMCLRRAPWTPNARGAAYQMVATLTAGMSIVRVDPNKSGNCLLTGNNKTMWVWQDRANWTNFPGNTCMLTNIPARATELRIYGWDGLRKTMRLHGEKALRLGDLPGNETYLFVANAEDTRSSGGRVLP